MQARTAVRPSAEGIPDENHPLTKANEAAVEEYDAIDSELSDAEGELSDKKQQVLDIQAELAALQANESKLQKALDEAYGKYRDTADAAIVGEAGLYDLSPLSEYGASRHHAVDG